MEHVCEQVNVSGITKAASKPHQDANVIYSITLKKINELAVAQRDLARRIIAWLTFAKKPFEEDELKEAFATDNETGRVNSALHFNVENVLEYCRGLVTRAEIRRVPYLRLAHMTVQEYFSQVESFQQHHLDMCLTCFSRSISCLLPISLADQEQSSSYDQEGETRDEYDDLNEVADENLSDLSISGASGKSDFRGVEGSDNGEWSEDYEEEDESEDSDSQIIKEDHRSWRFGREDWPKTLMPWIVKETPFSKYAGTYALSHLQDTVLTTDLEQKVLEFVKTAISRRRRSTFSKTLQDHPFGMNLLHMATFIGIPSVVHDVLEMPMIHVDDKDFSGRTALMWALALGKASVAERLLEGGAQIQEYDNIRRSTLMYAPAINNEGLLTKLLQGVPDEDIHTGFLCSCAKADNDYLIDGALSRAKLNVNQVDRSGRTPLHEAVMGNSEAALRSLIRHRAQFSILDREGRTPLMYAAQSQNSEIVKTLIQNGARAEPPGPKSESPLHVAAKNVKGGPKILRILLQADANIFDEDSKGLVPLQTLLRISKSPHWSEKETLACVRLLSRDRNTISHQSNDGANALHDVVKCPYASILKYLVSRAPPNAINSQNKIGQAPIFEALIAYNVLAFNFLIDLPSIDLLAMRNDNMNLLTCAAWADEVTVAHKLIHKEPRLIALAEQHSVSAIHYAVERDNPAMFDLLLESGSNPRSRRHELNRDLISYAAFEGRIWCLDKLLELRAWMAYDHSGQLVTHRDDLGRTLLHEAAASGDTAMLSKVLNSFPLEGLSLEDRDALGQTALHYATRSRNETLVSLLLTAGSDTNALTLNGETPLDLAIYFEASHSVGTLVLADAQLGHCSRPNPSKIQRYKEEDFFAKLVERLAATTITPGRPRNGIMNEVQPPKEKTVHRIGTEYDVFSELSPDVPFLEIIIPEDAALPIDQVVFETVSHDQGELCSCHSWCSLIVCWQGGATKPTDGGELTSMHIPISMLLSRKLMRKPALPNQGKFESNPMCTLTTTPDYM